MAKTKEIITYISIITVFILFVVVVEGKSNSINSLLQKLNLVPVTETFTELYFDDYSKLPTKSIAGDVTNFTFTIHNLEGKYMTYPYTVYFEYPSGQKVTIKSGQVDVPENGYANVNVKYTFQTSNLFGKVYVKLNNLDQKINFILPNYN
jgi:hypothetical protein